MISTRFGGTYVVTIADKKGIGFPAVAVPNPGPLIIFL